MLQVNLHQSGLSDVVDRVHQLFEKWETTEAALPRVNAETLVCTRIVLHEWVANLLQHADFEGREPTIVIGMYFDDGRAECYVRDNSAGFDILPYLCSHPEQHLRTLPDGGMGLTMLQSCTETIMYSRTDDGEFQLDFTVSAEHGQFSTLYAMMN